MIVYLKEILNQDFLIGSKLFSSSSALVNRLLFVLWLRFIDSILALYHESKFVCWMIEMVVDIYGPKFMLLFIN